MSWEDAPDYGGPKPSWREAAAMVIVVAVVVGLYALVRTVIL